MYFSGFRARCQSRPNNYRHFLFTAVVDGVVSISSSIHRFGIGIKADGTPFRHMVSSILVACRSDFVNFRIVKIETLREQTSGDSRVILRSVHLDPIHGVTTATTQYDEPTCRHSNTVAILLVVLELLCLWLRFSERSGCKVLPRSTRRSPCQPSLLCLSFHRNCIVLLPTTSSCDPTVNKFLTKQL